MKGLEAIREWVSKDERYISMIGECEIMRDAVNILRRRTIGDGEVGREGKEEGREGEGEEGVSVREKNGILGILLEVVEGGGWKEGYEELEDVVSRLESEGKKGWRERRGEKGKNWGREWKEMGRLAQNVELAIEENRGREEGGEREGGRGGDGGIITVRGMKKNLEEERKRADEEKRKREETERKADEERNRAEQEKRELEGRLRRMTIEMEQLKKREEGFLNSSHSGLQTLYFIFKLSFFPSLYSVKEVEDKETSSANQDYRKITQLEDTETVKSGPITLSGNTIGVSSGSSWSNCRVGRIYSRVCIHSHTILLVCLLFVIGCS